MILVTSEANVKRLPRSNCQARMTGVSRLQHIDLAKPEIRMINNPIFWFEKMFQNIAKFQHENEVSSWDSHDAWWSNESWMDGSCVSLNRENNEELSITQLHLSDGLLAPQIIFSNHWLPIRNCQINTGFSQKSWIILNMKLILANFHYQGVSLRKRLSAQPRVCSPDCLHC